VPGRRTLRHVLRRAGRAPRRSLLASGTVTPFWIWVQVAIVILVIAAAIIAVVKL
jgi:hypothetical protein